MIGTVRLTEWSLVDENGDFCIPSREMVTSKDSTGGTSTKLVEVKAHINGTIDIKKTIQLKYGGGDRVVIFTQRGIVTAPVMEIRKRSAFTAGRGRYTLGVINPEYRKWLKANHPDWDWKKPFARKAVTT